MKDPYEVLGLPKNASDAEIKKTYKRLARKFHPDINKEAGAEEKFKELNEAYEVLKDPEKKAQYDQFGAAGFEGFGAAGFDSAGFGYGNFGSIFSGGFSGFGDIEDILRQSGFGRENLDKQHTVKIDMLLSITGGERDLVIEGKAHKLKIPAGIEDGKRLKLKGLGKKGAKGEVGDLYLKVIVEPNSQYEREGDDLRSKLDVDLKTALLGGKVADVPTPYGARTISIPAGIENGKLLRIPKHGVAQRGDLYLRVNILMPKELNEQFKEAAQKYL